MTASDSWEDSQINTGYSLGGNTEYFHQQSDFRALEKKKNAKRLAPDCKALSMLIGNAQFLGGWALHSNGTQYSPQECIAGLELGCYEYSHNHSTKAMLNPLSNIFPPSE